MIGKMIAKITHFKGYLIINYTCAVHASSSSSFFCCGWELVDSVVRRILETGQTFDKLCSRPVSTGYLRGAASVSLPRSET